jgi:ribosomal protein L14
MIMIHVSTLLKVADNSGARFLYCIHIPHTCSRLGAFPGLIIKGSVRKLILKKNLKKSRVLQLGQICLALIVRTVYGFKR